MLNGQWHRIASTIGLSVLLLSVIDCGYFDTATNLTNYNGGNDTGPNWSPDGTRITFISDRDWNHEIYTMNADGTDQTHLTRHTASEYHPDWSPDGTKIAFASYRDGNSEIYVMDVK